MARILAIEDELSIRMNLQQILELSDFETVVAENGEQGLSMALAIQPDLIISDIRMPKLDGYAFLTALRQNPATQHIPLIFLTAKADRRDYRQGMDLGADDYLCKPFTPEELLNAIHGRLQHKARTDERHKTEMNDLCYHLSRSLPHELNTPLNSILGLTDLLIQQHRHLDGEVDREEQLQMLETVRNSSKRLYRVIQNSLIYADLELKAHQPQAITKLKKNFGSQGIEIESFLRGLGQKMALERDRSADLHYDLLPLRVQVPEVQLNKIFQEILDNAFKFSAPGTPVKLVSSLADTMVKIEVQDQGRGMNPSQIASVKAYLQFERRLYEQQGCGLGLAIARRMSELFGGSLAISSIPQQHTTVSVLLPQSSSEGL